MNYHKLRLENLKETWDKFRHDMGFSELEPILVQTVRLDNIIDLLIKKHTTKDCSKSSCDSGSSSSHAMESTLPNDGLCLLKEILSLLLTIRGHSIAGSWMETYKSLNKAGIKQKRSAEPRQILKLKASKKKK